MQDRLRLLRANAVVRVERDHILVMLADTRIGLVERLLCADGVSNRAQRSDVSAALGTGDCKRASRSRSDGPTRRHVSHDWCSRIFAIYDHAQESIPWNLPGRQPFECAAHRSSHCFRWRNRWPLFEGICEPFGCGSRCRAASGPRTTNSDPIPHEIDRHPVSPANAAGGTFTSRFLLL